ncbi:CoA-acylating methylmalonate-semialdehyde dehydrogenase [Streptomyces sp. NPDC048278]|uniref:CoA-acylating methylmalonate-semialdehyde dehydrogenase n=1 Tax=unclassified Streptomyces TaxID=2593676 RepID=UPI0034327B38
MSTDPNTLPVIPHFVGGERVPGTSGRLGDVFDPNTGRVQAHVALADAAETRAAIADAERAQRDWAEWNPQRRARVLMRFAQLVERDMTKLARALSGEHGKTLADAEGDIRRGLDVVEFAAGVPHLLKGEHTHGAGGGIDVYSLRQPLGVVAGITPFNFPAMIPLWKAAPAIACGNAFVLKPSERDPSVPLLLAELFLEAGLPPGVLNVVNGDREAVEVLLTDDRVRAVGFVGSTLIAQYVYETAARHGKRAQCFGGAKNHALVMPDADLDEAADAIVGAAYGSAGERCMALSVVVPVGEETAERLLPKLVERIKALRIGRSDDPGSDFGPLVGADAVARVDGYVELGVSEGAELVLDGRGQCPAGHEGGFFTGPTLFDRVTPDMRGYREEIFGPVLQIVRAADFEEAVRLPSQHEYGNGGAVFTRDGRTAREFAQRVQVGMVGVNVPIPVPIAYHTFGGWKRSGFGDLNQHGPDSIRFYTRTKTVTQRWPSGAPSDRSQHFVIPNMA